MKDYLVVQNNDIIEASYCLSVNEQRLLLACISQVDSRKNANFDFTKGVSLTVEQSQDLFYTEKNRQNAYYDLKTACEKLYRREVKLQSENGRFERLLRWVSSVEFDNDEMKSTLYFSREIQPYISELSNNFTEYRIRNIVQLSSKYAIRIYEIIVSWYGQNCSYKEMEITEFRELLDLGTKYKQHGELNRYVIKPALKEINDYTDFEMEISFKKRGRAFRWIQLRFNQKVDAKKEEEKRKLKREQREADKLSGIEHRDDDTVDIFTRISDKQIIFIAQNHVFQEHLGSLGKLPAGEKYGSERVVESSISFLKKGDFDEVTKYVIQGTLKKVKQQ